MRSLPAHHVARPRLTARCLEHRVVVVEAAGGFGKSVFAAELVDAWGLVGVEVALHEGGVPAKVLVARLRAAIAAAGFSQAADDAASAPEDLVGAVDVMLASLAGEPCAFVVDDAHHADRDAGLLLDRIAAGLADGQRLVVLGRRLPRGAERLRRADALQLTAADLALTGDETLRLCRVGFGLQVDEEAAVAIDGATGGWTAAAVLAAARAQRTGEYVPSSPSTRPKAPASARSPRSSTRPCSGSTTRAARARPGRAAAAPQRRASWTRRRAGFFDRVLAAGTPFFATDDGWWDLAGPVREFLASLAGPDPTRCAGPPRGTGASASSPRRSTCCSPPATTSPRPRCCRPATSRRSTRWTSASTAGRSIDSVRPRSARIRWP